MLLDSNIIIYAVKPDYPDVRAFVKQHDVMSSAISRTETLGYHDLDEVEASKLHRLFELITVQPITAEVIQRSIELRRRRRGMSTVDAIIGATALTVNVPLVTHDTADFDWIEELEIVDPVAGT
ncbi:MAG: type II toxin-antitoxin system VapC family toxin [Salinivenus sp.]